MGVGVQRVAAHEFKQLQEVRAAIHLRPQHQGIDEEADQPFGLGPATIGDRCTDADIVLPRVARQQYVEGRRQRHEQRALSLAAQRIEGCRRGCRQRELLRRATVALMCGTRMVGRQRKQGRRTGKVSLPVIELPLQHLAAEPLALPMGEVCVLDRQFGQRRRLPLNVGAVQRGHFTHQNTDRPAIGNDVVHRQQDDMLGIAQAQQARAYQRSGRQIERHLRFGVKQRAGLGFALGLRQVRQIPRLQR
ncbi:hypothetical protein DUGA6_62080 [Duganella sp. HH105]|nr:hypothetical protein DUGA6_62080 [Duganella sp. HH105]